MATTEKGNMDIAILESWRYTLLSMLTGLNEDIHVFHAAVEGEL